MPLSTKLVQRPVGLPVRAPARRPHTAAAVLAQERDEIARFCRDLVHATRQIESVPRRTGCPHGSRGGAVADAATLLVIEGVIAERIVDVRAGTSTSSGSR